MLDTIGFLVGIGIAVLVIWHIAIVPMRGVWRRHRTRRHELKRPGYIDLRPRL
jgi:hypothetical protein